MPEIKFYITDDERKELFDFISSNDGRFIPDLIYDTSEFYNIKNGEELIKCIYEKAASFFLISPAFQIEPLVIHQFAQKYERIKGKYGIDQRTGGPYISLIFFTGFGKNTSIKYKCTNVFHYPRYLHHDWETNYGEFPVSEELKSYYKMIIKFLKSKCRQVKAKNGKKYWVSKTLKEADIL
jgi:hypothetical protein